MTLFIVLHVEETEDILPPKLALSKALITYELGKSGDNPHYHIIVETDIKPVNLRQMFVSKHKLRPKKISITVCKDLSKSIRYILKEEKIVYNTLLTDVELEKALIASREVSEEIQEIKKTKKKSNLYILLDTYKVRIPEELFSMDMLIDDVTQHILTTFNINVVLWDPSVIRKYTFTMLCTFYPELFKRQFIRYNRYEIKKILFYDNVHNVT